MATGSWQDLKPRAYKALKDVYGKFPLSIAGQSAVLDHAGS
jgi:hypothetical protein